MDKSCAGSRNDLIESFILEVARSHPRHEPFLRHAVAKLEPPELADFLNLLAFHLHQEMSLIRIAECYGTILRDTIREQLHFKRHGAYRFSRLSDVADSVYHDPDYMTRYMVGLGLTSFLWPNHSKIKRYFESFLSDKRPASYLEIGPGHGLFFMAAMRRLSCDCFVGVDFSESSIGLTEDLLSSGSFGRFERYRLVLADFLDWETDSEYSMIVMGEVLEHVEEPARFLRKIRSVAAPGASLFITTCVNAPAVDHIYLFHDADEILKMVRSERFSIVDSLLLPHEGYSIEECLADKHPVNVALVLSTP